MKKLIITSLLLSSGFLKAQDMHFSQFVMSPVFLNPANSGAENKIRAIMNYREQWKSVASPYKTFGLSYDMRVHESSSGFFALGATVFNDKAGDAQMKIFQGNINLAYHLTIKKGMNLGVGIMGGFAQRSVDLNGLEWGNQYDGYDYDGTMDNGEPAGFSFTNSYGDVGAGITYTYSKGSRYMTGNDQLAIVAGFSVMHPHQPNYSFYDNPDEKLYMKVVAHGNAVIGMGDKNSRLSIAPGYLFCLQGGARELLFGSMFKYKLKEASHFTGFVNSSSLAIGCFYRNKDAVIIKSMFTYANYSLGFSYDLNVSDLKPTSKGKGGFELSLRFIAPIGVGTDNSTRFL